MNSEKHLYRFNDTKEKQFKMWQLCLDSNVDRKSWKIGMCIEIYVEFSGWFLADIIEIVEDVITVLCQYENKKITFKRNDIMIRSTRKFLYNRIKLDKGMRVQVFGNCNNEWYLGEITDVKYDDATDELFILYETNDHKVHQKYFSRWSPCIGYSYFGQ